MDTRAAVLSPPISIGGQIRDWIAFFKEFLRLAGPYGRSEGRWLVLWLTGALIALTMAQVGVAVAMNGWIEQLFNALEQRAVGEFLWLSGLLGAIILANVAVVTIHLRVKRQLQIDWRRWLSGRLVDEWMVSGRHYQVSLIPGEHDNPDARIAEDIRISTEYAIDLAHSLLYCGVLLVSFTHILWRLSGSPYVALGAVQIFLPGHLVWIAVLYAALGTAVALLLGRPLIRAANNRQTAEANFRFGLVHARENTLAIALLQGERDERRRFGDLFAGALAAWDRQTTALTHIFLFVASWSVLSQAFPILVSAPRYIAGAITLGVLMQTAQAFQQMVAALSWPIDNLAKVAEWRASVERVRSLHAAIAEVSQRGDAGRRHIAVTRTSRPVLVFTDFTLTSPRGEVVIDHFSAEIAEGERVLITGESGATVNLFKAVLGLWPWGSGTVAVPADARVFVVPHRPYLPLSALRDAISYPDGGEAFGTEAVAAALERVGLAELVARLDDVDKWAQVLAAREQRRLGFARLLLHRPNWIFIQEAIDALDAPGEQEMMVLLSQEFPEATVVTIGHRPAGDTFYRRVFIGVRGDGAARLIEADAAAVSGP